MGFVILTIPALLGGVILIMPPLLGVVSVANGVFTGLFGTGAGAVFAVV